MLTVNVGTLGLCTARKNCFGAAKKRVRRARVAGSLDGDSIVGQSQQAQGGQKQALHEPSTSGTQGVGSVQVKSGHGQKLSQGPSKHQTLSRALLGVGRQRGPELLGNLAMSQPLGRVSGWSLSVKAIRRLRSPKMTSLTFNELLAGLWMSSLKRGSPPGSSICSGLRGLPLWCARMMKPGIGWLVTYQP